MDSIAFRYEHAPSALLLRRSRTQAHESRFCRAEIKSTKTPFLFLALDLPPPPLFQDAVETNIIPQVPISAVLSKYDGSTTREDTQAGVLKRSKITRLPPFLIVYYKRFLSNRFLEEKNPTIVNFPLKGVDMSECAWATSARQFVPVTLCVY